MMKQERILFVCLGNIIRSPLAENLFLQVARERDLADAFDVDSAGTSSYHIGESPDTRMRRTAAAHGYQYDGRGRQLTLQDLDEFDWIIAMDQENARAIRRMADGRDLDTKLRLMREFDPQAGGDLDVPDPYYGGPDGFERTFEIVERSVRSLIDELSES
jgi:protein-tyrosine phosphatase